MSEINDAGEATMINAAKGIVYSERLRFDPFIAGGFDVD
jgi:redox-sensitive bicupin YhaK (pirin superfamily)